jgi:hypothetical protein
MNTTRSPTRPDLRSRSCDESATSPTCGFRSLSVGPGASPISAARRSCHVSVGAAHGCRGVDRCNRQSDERCSTVDFSAAGSQVLDEQLLGLGLRHPERESGMTASSSIARRSGCPSSMSRNRSQRSHRRPSAIRGAGPHKRLCNSCRPGGGFTSLPKLSKRSAMVTI